MAILNTLYVDDLNEYEIEDDVQIVFKEDAEAYATSVAEEAINEYVRYTKQNTKENEMQKTIDRVSEETKLNGKIVTGEILLQNIETLVENVILSRLSWWQKLTMSNKRKEQLVTVGVYVLTQVIRNGVFGYKIEHPSIDYISLASNKKIMMELVKLTGIDTDIIKTLLVKPSIVKE